MTRRAISDLATDSSGATAVLTGVLMLVGLGFVGLAVDTGTAYAVQRKAQSAADSAAYSAAVSVWRGGQLSDAQTQARAIAAEYGIKPAADTTIAVAMPSSYSPPDGRPAAGAVEVVITQPFRRFFSQLFDKSPATIRARAVAARGAAGDGCVLALNPTAAMSLQYNGNTRSELKGCSIYGNSSNSWALLANGTNTINAKSIDLVGGYMTNGSNNAMPTPRTGASATEDPYKAVEMPPTSGCTGQPSEVNGGRRTYQPGVFCSGLSLNGSSGDEVEFKPGVYVIKNQPFRINGAIKVRGDNVTFVLTGDTAASVSTATINGTAQVNFTAPSSGPYAGMVFYQDRKAGAGTNVINGNAASSFTGALYFPKQTLTFNGTGDTQSDGCTQLIADKFIFNGNANLALNCEGVGTKGFGGAAVRLTE